MNALMITALVMAVPVMLVPVALVWYINIGGIFAAIREAREKKVTERTTEGIII
jgi:hypothetical protein